MSTAFPQGKLLMPDGQVTPAWRKLLQNLWQATAQASATLLVPSTTTVNGHPLSGDVSVTKTDVGLGNVTNDAQTLASIVPNTAPSLGQVLIGGGANYVPRSFSGDVSLSGTGAATVSAIGGKAVSLAGALTTSGAFASTFTMTGVTSVTFPTSGTLATVNGTTAGGGSVVQATDKTTGVTLNGATGQITTANSALAANAVASFALTNSSVAAGDMVLVMVLSGDANTGSYDVWAERSAGGAVAVVIHNVSAIGLSEALVLRFVVIKSVTA